MHTTSLRKVGGSVMLAVPSAFLDQLHLQIGAKVGLVVNHGCLIVDPNPKPKYRLEDLMAEMPNGLPRVEGWEEMPSVGLEED